MTVWDKMAIFETTAKNSVLGRWVLGTDLQYEKKMKNNHLYFFNLIFVTIFAFICGRKMKN
jgi:hypothetical protein